MATWSSWQCYKEDVYILQLFEGFLMYVTVHMQLWLLWSGHLDASSGIIDSSHSLLFLSLWFFLQSISGVLHPGQVCTPPPVAHAACKVLSCIVVCPVRRVLLYYEWCFTSLWNQYNINVEWLFIFLNWWLTKCPVWSGYCVTSTGPLFHDPPHSPYCITCPLPLFHESSPGPQFITQHLPSIHYPLSVPNLLPSTCPSSCPTVHPLWKNPYFHQCFDQNTKP